MPLGNSWEGGLTLRPASQETCHRSWKPRTAGGAVGEGRCQFTGLENTGALTPVRSCLDPPHPRGAFMHIEPGVLSASKILYANVTAASTLTGYLPSLLRRPANLLKIGLAAGFFSVFMEIFHMPVGPSELHFVGASAVYFVFGFLPTLFGFAIGLL